MIAIHANIKVFANAASLYMIVDIPNETARLMNTDLKLSTNGQNSG